MMRDIWHWAFGCPGDQWYDVSSSINSIPIGYCPGCSSYISHNKIGWLKRLVMEAVK